MCIPRDREDNKKENQSNPFFFLFFVKEKKRNSKTMTTDRCWGSRFFKWIVMFPWQLWKWDKSPTPPSDILKKKEERNTEIDFYILHDRSVVVINGTGSKSLSASFVACVMLVGIPPIFSFSFCLSLRLDIRLLWFIPNFIEVEGIGVVAGGKRAGKQSDQHPLTQVDERMQSRNF